MASKSVQEAVMRLDVDILGIASLSNLQKSILEETALQLLPEAKSIVVVGRAFIQKLYGAQSRRKSWGMHPCMI
jgi:hypothetical protein